MADRTTTVGTRVRTVRRPSLLRWPLRIAVVVYLALLVIWPVAIVAVKTFERGLGPVLDALGQPEVLFAFELTVANAFWAVLINTVFGVGISLLLVRYEFPGRRALSALVDLPLSVSPVVVGLALLLVYSGRTGWFGPALQSLGLQVIYAQPGHDHGHGVRQPAAGDPRGRPGAARDRHRAGAGRQQPRRVTAADLRPHHPARRSAGP